MTPAELIIEKLGGVRATARAIGRDPSAICKWKQKGSIPMKAALQILEYAKANGIDITPNDLIMGRSTGKKIA